MKKLTLLSTLIFAVITITAQVIHVPADQPTIQAGIDVSTDGDTVLVAEGTYLENINFDGKAITLASQFLMDGDTNHIANTIIDGSDPDDPNYGSVVLFESGEDTTSILCGFTITGGTGTHFIDGPVEARAGGGAFFNRSGAKLTYNYIVENEVSYSNLTMGGGIVAGGLIDPQPWLVLRKNRIMNNSSISTGSQANGGGMEVYCNLIMVENKITHNEANSATLSIAGGVSIRAGFGPIDIDVRNNLITQNKSVSNTTLTEYSESGGLFIGLGCSGTVSNNIISFNEIEVPEEKNCYGAGVFIGAIGTDFLFENNIIKDNYTIKGQCVGGGLCIWQSGGTYQNNVIQNNTGTWGGGVGIVNNNSDSLAVLINNTITGNEGVYGGGLYMYLADAVVINTILWDNEAFEEGDEIFDLESNLEVRYSDVEGEEEWPGNGNVMIDPGFASDGYHLDWESELVNQGISAIQIGNDWYDAPEYDIDGDDRPFDGTDPDIGADEALWYYVQIPESASKETSSLNVFPNPVSSSFATIEYKLDRTSVVQVSLFNQFGEMVEVLVDEHQSKGNYQIVWNFESLPAGIYFCYLKTISGTQTTKIIKLK